MLKFSPSVLWFYLGGQDERYKNGFQAEVVLSVMPADECKQTDCDVTILGCPQGQIDTDKNVRTESSAFKDSTDNTVGAESRVKG